MNKSLLSIMVLFFLWSLVVVLSGDSHLIKNASHGAPVKSIQYKNGYTLKHRLCKKIAHRQVAATANVKPIN